MEKLNLPSFLQTLPFHPERWVSLRIWRKDSSQHGFWRGGPEMGSGLCWSPTITLTTGKSSGCAACASLALEKGDPGAQ